MKKIYGIPVSKRMRRRYYDGFLCIHCEMPRWSHGGIRRDACVFSPTKFKRLTEHDRYVDGIQRLLRQIEKTGTVTGRVSYGAYVVV